MEKVHFQLESTLPELKDLQEKGLFTKQELRQITLHRTKHESALIKRAGKPEDFLKYAEYEIGIERLRKIRWKRLRLDKTQQPRSISSHSIPRRILYILRRATEKFPRDLRVWLAYVDYAKSEGMSKVVVNGLTSALQLHPLEPVLYILLCQHYLDPIPPSHKRANVSSSKNSTFSIENIPPARKTLLLGLRFLPNNVDLWLEYVKLEVGWVEALRRRWKVLGILDEVVGGVKQEVDDARDIEGGEGFETNPAIENEDGMEEDEGKGAFGAGGEDARKRLTNGDLILTVLKNSFGRSGLKDNLSYRLRLLELFRDYPSGLRSRLLKAVYESMRSSQTLVKDCTARRIWIEAELFDAKYDPNVSDEIEQPAGYAPIEGEGKRVVLHGEALVLAIAKVVKGLKGKQEIESALEATELSQWRAQWEETVGLWLLRWTSRTQGNDDLQKYLLASLSSLTKASDLLPIPSSNLLASHLAFLLSLPPISPVLPSMNRLRNTARDYTQLQPASSIIWKSRLEVEKLATLGGDTAELGRLYLSAMDRVGASEGAVEIWVQGLSWFDSLPQNEQAGSTIMREHWRSGLRSARRFVGDSAVGVQGEILYAGVMSGWVKSVLAADVGNSSIHQELASKVVDVVVSPDWLTPARALSEVFEVVAGLDQIEDATLAPLLKSIYETWHKRSRHNAEQKVLACLTYVSWLLNHTTGRVKAAMDVVENVKKEVETGEAGGLEGKGGPLRRDQRFIEQERREMVARLEEGWRTIIKEVELRRAEQGEDSDQSDESDSDDSSESSDSSEGDAEDVEME